MKALLLISTSRESQNKAKQLAAAAASRKVQCVISDRWSAGYDIEIPCSDAKVGATRWGASLDCLGSKLATARMLQDLGLPFVPTYPVLCNDDVLSLPLTGAVFIKSDRSSGAVSPHPFGYRRFESKEHLYEVLQHKYVTALTHDQYQAVFGCYVVQPYVPNDGMLTVSYIGGQALAPAFVKTDADCFYEYMHFSSTWDKGQGAILRPLADYVNVPFLYIQGLLIDGVLTPIDINVRLSTYLDTLMTAEDSAFYDRCWAALLNHVPQDWGIPEALIGRIKTDWRHPSTAFADATKARLLNFGDNIAAIGKFDAAYSYPTYIIRGNDVVQRRLEFLKTVAVTQPMKGI